MFYDNLLKLCAQRNESPSGVAKKIGLSNAAASGWKSGKKPSRLTLEKLSIYFKVPVEELEKEKPADQVADGLTEEEVEYIKWFRTQATEKEKTLVRIIVKGEAK